MYPIKKKVREQLFLNKKNAGANLHNRATQVKKQLMLMLTLNYLKKK
jgi:hypothetical protein